MLVLDREAAIAAWRRAESRIYPSVMLNADLYQQYIGLVRAIAELLEDVRTEDELVVAWTERRELVQEAVSRRQPSMLGADGPRGGARRRVLPPPPRDHARAGQGARARAARARAASRAPSGSCCSRTSRRSARTGSRCTSRSGRALHASSELPLDASRPKFTLEVVQLDPGDGAWLLDQPPLHAGAELRHPRGMGGAHRPGAQPIRKGLTWPRTPRRSSTPTATSARSRRGSSTTSSTR